MNIDFRPSNFNAKSNLKVLTVLYRKKKDKLKNDGMIRAHKPEDVVKNITLTEDVMYVLDGGGDYHKIQKKRISTEEVMEVEKNKVRKGVV